MTEIEAFFKSHNNKSWDKYGRLVETSFSQVAEPFAGQCVSLVKTYLIYLFGQDKVKGSYGDAKDYWLNRGSNGILQLCDAVDGFQDGDIVVSAGSDPRFGHIWIYYKGQAFSQNVCADPRALLWPLSYQGTVFGILRPRLPKQEPMKEITPVKEEKYGSVYRLYNPVNGDHLYTISFAEARACQSAGWEYEGVVWNAPSKGDSVYRLLNPNNRKHHYTTDSDESKALVDLGWIYEGVAFCSGGSRSIYRMYNPNGGEHIFTGLSEEHDALTKAGWKCEGQPLKGTK